MFNLKCDFIMVFMIDTYSQFQEIVNLAYDLIFNGFPCRKKLNIFTMNTVVKPY